MARDAPTCHLVAISAVSVILCLADAVFQLVRGHVSTAAWHVSPPTSLHVIIGTRPSPSLFLHGCETKAGVGSTGNKANTGWLRLPHAQNLEVQNCRYFLS